MTGEKMDGLSQAELSNEWIIAALLDLMKEKTFADINITEITQRAGVARLTFYRRFLTKEAVINEFLQRIFANYHANIQSDVSLSEMLTHLFEYLVTDTADITLLAKNNLTYLFEHVFYEYLIDLTIDMPELKNLSTTQRNFMFAGVTRVTTAWLQASESMTARELTQEICALLKINPNS